MEWPTSNVGAWVEANSSPNWGRWGDTEGGGGIRQAGEVWSGQPVMWELGYVQKGTESLEGFLHRYHHHGTVPMARAGARKDENMSSKHYRPPVHR